MVFTVKPFIKQVCYFLFLDFNDILVKNFVLFHPFYAYTKFIFNFYCYWYFHYKLFLEKRLKYTYDFLSVLYLSKGKIE